MRIYLVAFISYPRIWIAWRFQLIIVSYCIIRRWIRLVIKLAIEDVGWNPYWELNLIFESHMMMLDEGVYGWYIDGRVNNMVLFCWWTTTRWEYRGLLLYYIQELWHVISMCHWGLFQCIMDIYTRTMLFKEQDKTPSCLHWHLKEDLQLTSILHSFILVNMLWLLNLNSKFEYGLFQPTE